MHNSTESQTMQISQAYPGPLPPVSFPLSILIPHHWYKIFTGKRGTPDHDLITILSEIVYWYRPARVTDPVTGKTHYGNKFKGTHWQTSYNHFKDKFGFSHEKVRKVLVRLEEKGIIKRIFKHVIIDGQRYNNRLFISLDRKFLEKTLGNNESRSNYFENSKLDVFTQKTSEIETIHKNQFEDRNSSLDQPEVKILAKAQLRVDKIQPKVQRAVKTESVVDIKTMGHSISHNSLKHKAQGLDQEKIALEQHPQTPPNQTLKLSSFPISSKAHPSPHLEGDHIISNKNNIINLDIIDNNNTQVSARGGEEGEGLSISNFSKKDLSNSFSIIKAKSEERTSRGNYSPSSAIKSSPTSKFPLKTPKTLADFYPLLEEDASFLRNSSNREFSLHAMNEILKSLIKKLQNRIFYTKQAFLSYMSKIFAHEMRQATIVNNNTFRITASMTDEEREAQAQEKYLTKLEQSSDITPDTLFRKRLAALLPKEKAYELLLGLRKIEIENRTLKLSLAYSVNLSDREKKLVLEQATEIYSRSREMDGKDCNLARILLVVDRRNNSWNNRKTGANSPSPSPFVGIWGRIRQGLINHCNSNGKLGEGIDKSWFSKLEVDIDEKNKKLTLKAPTSFIKSWINSNYYSDIRIICDQLGYCFEGIDC